MTQNVIVPTMCPHCKAEDRNAPDLPVTDTGYVVNRVLWKGLTPKPQGRGLVPSVHLDLAAGMLPSQVEFPIIAKWVPAKSYCPNCRTEFYCGPDWRTLTDETPSPILMPK